MRNEPIRMELWSSDVDSGHSADVCVMGARMLADRGGSAVTSGPNVIVMTADQHKAHLRSFHQV